MPKIEVEESDLLASAQTVKAVQAMLANPKARSLLLNAQKIINPNAVIPEIDAKAPIEAEIAKEREARLALEKRLDDEKAANEAAAKTRSFKDKWEADKADLRRQGYTDEGVSKIEKLAEERGIPSLEAAAALFDKLNPPATVAAPSGGIGGWDLFQPAAEEDTNMKKLLESKGEDNMALNSMINSALTEVRGKARR
jgi:hypothetical protein